VGGISLIAVGVDVSVKRRLDVVVLDESGRIVEAPRERQSAEDLEAALSRLHPAVVAIDSPPAFGVDGRSRLAERRLMQVGINIYATPSDPAARSRPFYRWILAGMEAYEAAERAGFFLYRGPGPVTGRAIEVFPHASAVCLRGKLPPLRLRRKSQRAQWRKAALASRGVAVETLHSLDQVDAALAALTGLLAVRGIFTAVGSPDEGVIVLPVAELPERYSREVEPLATGHDQGLERLAELIRQRNATEEEISRIIGRPAQIGHIGEYIASRIFGITLSRSATEEGIDGVFGDGPLAGKSVNIKWYAKDEGLLDLSLRVVPDYYLVLAGPRSGGEPSKESTRPWLIRSVYLFEAPGLHEALRARGIRLGIATSVISALWKGAEVFPEPRNPLLPLSDEQRRLLSLFG